MDKLQPYIEKILQSESFKNKETAKRLLNYLATAGKEKQDLKEMHIAENVFNRDSSFDPADDAIVRVSIHKLRQNLRLYYANEGKDDKLRISISKGKYNIQISQKESVKKAGRLPWRTLILLTLFLMINILITITLTSNKKTKAHPVWNSFIKNTNPTVVVLGNPAFFRIENPNEDVSYIIRDINFNNSSSDDSSLFTFVKENDLQIHPLEYPYFSKNNVWPLIEISTEFIKNDKQLSLKSLQEFDAGDVNRQNIIFIANINSFSYFEQLLKETSIKINLSPREIIINDTLVLSSNEIASSNYTDYAFMVKLPGQNDCVNMLIGDFHSSGNKSLVETITNENRLNSIISLAKSRYGSFPEYFELVIKVSGYSYSNIDSEVIYFNKLEN